MSEARPIGPEIGALIADPNETLDRWTANLEAIQKKTRLTALQRPDGADLDEIVAAVRPYRYFLDAFTVAKSVQMFVHDHGSSIGELPNPIRTFTDEGEAPPFFLLGEKIVAGMIRSAKRTRRMMKRDPFESRILALSDYVDAVQHFLNPRRGFGPRFEYKSVEFGGRTGVMVGMAFHSHAKVLWRHRFGVEPTDQQLADSVKVSHRAPKALAAMGMDDFAARALEALPFDQDMTYGRSDGSWLQLAELPDEAGVYEIEIASERSATIAGMRNGSRSPNNAVVMPHIGCLAMVPFPDLLTEWAGNVKGPRNSGIDLQLDYLTKLWVAENLWDEVVIEQHRDETAAFVSRLADSAASDARYMARAGAVDMARARLTLAAHHLGI